MVLNKKKNNTTNVVHYNLLNPATFLLKCLYQARNLSGHVPIFPRSMIFLLEFAIVLTVCFFFINIFNAFVV